MKSFTEAKGAAEKSGTDKSEKFRPTVQRFIIGFTVIVLLTVATISFSAYMSNRQQRLSAQQQQSTTNASFKQPDKAMMLTIQPGGKSERIPVPYQMHVDMNGKDFRFNCVYADGHEESFVPGERSCSNGDMPFVYATNTRTDGPNVITYSYEK